MKHDIEIYQGETLSLRLEVTNENGEPFDLTEYKSKMQIRQNPLDKIYMEIETSIYENYIYITIDKDKSYMLPSFPNNNYYNGALCYDVIIYNDVYLRNIIGGKIIVRPTVTKDGVFI